MVGVPNVVVVEKGEVGAARHHRRLVARADWKPPVWYSTCLAKGSSTLSTSSRVPSVEPSSMKITSVGGRVCRTMLSIVSCR